MGVPECQMRALGGVNSDQCRKAAGAILKHVKEKKQQPGSRRALFDDDDGDGRKIWLVCFI